MRIGIFTAMEKEAKSFLERGKTLKHNHGLFDVYEMELGRHSVYLCCPPNIGEITAAAAVQLLISEYKIESLVNFGVVGALTEDTSLLSTVYVGSVVHYEMDVSAMDGRPIGKYRCFDDVAVATDEDMLSKALSVENLPVVRCASADKFVDSPSDKTALSLKYGAQICDMECAAVVFICKFNSVPCLCVKCISDSLTGGVGEFAENAERAAAHFFDFAMRLADVL